MDAQKQPEPTMEEILASIRRIISEDGPPAEGAEAAAADDSQDVLELTEIVPETVPAPVAVAAPVPREPPRPPARSAQDDIDAIMNMDADEAGPDLPAPAEPPRAAPQPQPARPAAVPAEQPPASEPSFAAPAAAWDEPQPAFAPARSQPAPFYEEDDDADSRIQAVEPHDAILSNGAAEASTAALAGLSGALRPRFAVNGGMHIGSAGTLDELLRELLRPLLKEWLDAHLPTVVERLVQREIERIGKRAEGQ